MLLTGPRLFAQLFAACTLLTVDSLQLPALQGAGEAHAPAGFGAFGAVPSAQRSLVRNREISVLTARCASAFPPDGTHESRFDQVDLAKPLRTTCKPRECRGRQRPRRGGQAATCAGSFFCGWLLNLCVWCACVFVCCVCVLAAFGVFGVFGVYVNSYLC